MNAIIQQAGAMPFMLNASQLEVMLITAKNLPGRWALPKGHIEPGHSPQDTAVREAFEEAGIRGEIGAVPVGAYDYRKFNRDYHVLIYPLEITEILTQWPEQSFRQRQLLPVARALQTLSDANVREIVKAAAGILHKIPARRFSC